MNRKKESAAGYIKRGPELDAVYARIPKSLKNELEMAAEKLDISLNKLVEASIHYYLEKLKEENSI